MKPLSSQVLFNCVVIGHFGWGRVVTISISSPIIYGSCRAHPTSTGGTLAYPHICSAPEATRPWMQWGAGGAQQTVIGSHDCGFIDVTMTRLALIDGGFITI